MLLSTQGGITMNSINTIKSSENKACKSVGSKNSESTPCLPYSVEKLLTDISNKLGLSLAIYQK